MKVAARLPRSTALVVCAAFAAAPLAGCTLVGAGIGAGVDAMIPGPYEAHSSEERFHLESGKRVDLGLRDGKRVRGRYLGTHGPTRSDPETYLLVGVDDGVESVPASELRVVGIEVAGKGWIYGGLIGLAIDVAVIVTLAVFVATYDPDYSRMDLSFGK